MSTQEIIELALFRTLDTSWAEVEDIKSAAEAVELELSRRGLLKESEK